MDIIHQRSNDLIQPSFPQGEKPFACKLCQLAFKSAPELKRHELDVHSVCICFYTDEPFFRTFGKGPLHISWRETTLILIWQFSTIPQEKKFVCNQCGAAFGRNAGLKKHSQTHSVRIRGCYYSLNIIHWMLSTRYCQFWESQTSFTANVLMNLIKISSLTGGEAVSMRTMSTNLCL